MNLNVAVNLDFKNFAGATITNRDSGIFNGYVDKLGDKAVLTQRPSINVSEIAPVAKGRAVYYWDRVSLLYILNNDTIYKSNYANPIATLIDPGFDKCKFLQLNNLLILIDRQGSKGYTIDGGDVVAQIGGSFPAELALGGAVLDGYLFVMDKFGTIWNSALNDASTFNPGNNIDTEREEDGGVYLSKHHDHIVAFGERTIEFFYDNSNPTNSPLNRREDLTHTVGCAHANSVWEEGDTTIFIGSELSTGLSVYILEGFKLRIVSQGSLDALITNALVRDNYEVFASGFTANGHKFYFLTFAAGATDIIPEVTYVYDFMTNLWFEWDTDINNVSGFPIVDWSIRAGQNVVSGVGIFTDGDVIAINNGFTPRDTINANTYVTPATYVEAGYITDTGGSGLDIEMRVRFGMFDGETNKNKTMHKLRPRMDQTINPGVVNLSWSDNNNLNFINGGSIATEYQYDSLRRCGRFHRRNIEMQYRGSEQIYVESMEADIIPGTL